MKTTSSKRFRARFFPRHIDNLRPEMEPFVGKVAEWHFAGTGDDNEPFPGQPRWMAIDAGWPALWVPEEDLQDA